VISSLYLKGRISAFGALQAPATIFFFLLLSVPWDSIRVRNHEVYSRANVTRTLVFFDLSLVGSSLAEL
jgi:hypothetical protein